MNRAILWEGSAALGLLILALVGMILGISWRRQHPVREVPPLEVKFLDVGDGNCALIRTPGGRTILLDAGSEDAGATITGALHQAGVRRIDLLVLTSPNPENIGGIPAVLASGLPVTQVWDNAVADAGEARQDALEAIRRRHIPSRTAHAGDSIQIGEALSLPVLWPPEQTPASRHDPLICRIAFGSTVFLFEGGCTRAAEQDVVSGAGPQIECTGACTDLILQATHAEETPLPELLRRATPAIVVLSCGPDEDPSPAALHRFQAASSAVWRTDAEGTITIRTDGRAAPIVAAAQIQ